MEYKDGDLVRLGLPPSTDGITLAQLQQLKQYNNKLKTNSFWTWLGDLLSSVVTAVEKLGCWLAGGQWSSFNENTGLSPCNNWGHYSWIGDGVEAIGDLLSGIFSGDGNAGAPSSGPSGGTSGSGSTLIGNDYYFLGGGAVWITTYVADPNSGCPPTPVNPMGDKGLKINLLAPPEGCPPPSGVWQTYQIVLPTQSNNYIITRDTSITNIPRLDSIFKNLLSKNQVFDSLSHAYKNSRSYDLKYQVSNVLGATELGRTDFTGHTSATGQPLDGLATVSLNRSFINSDLNAKYVNIVRTILHETWHAELNYLLKTIYNEQDLTKIQQAYNIASINNLTIYQLIDLLAVDQNNGVTLGGVTITAGSAWSKLEHHNYMVKNINVLAKGIKQFLVSIQSPLANNTEFIYAEALSTLMPVSTYFQNSTNQTSFLQHFPGYVPAPGYLLSDYINNVLTNNINNLGPLR